MAGRDPGHLGHERGTGRQRLRLLRGPGAQTALEGARLDIERVPGVGECPQHGPVELDLALGLRCPLCGAPTPRLLQGDELELEALEVG